MQQILSLMEGQTRTPSQNNTSPNRRRRHGQLKRENDKVYSILYSKEGCRKAVQVLYYLYNTTKRTCLPGSGAQQRSMFDTGIPYNGEGENDGCSLFTGA